MNLKCISFALIVPWAMPASAQPGRSPADSIRILSSAASAAQVFVAKWRAEWLSNNHWGEVMPKGAAWTTALDEQGLPRLGPWTGCRPDSMLVRSAIRWSEHVIVSRSSAYCVRPNWPLVLGTQFPNTSVYIDSALAPSLRERMYARRDTLVAQIDAAATELPGDGWITGQRIRFRLDQAYKRHTASDEALAIARACRAEAWWCAALAGYVFHHRGEYAVADSAFEVARSRTPSAQRCGWEDLIALVDSTKRTTYADTPCDKRDAINRTLWWLSDPLWADPGNERRVEHYARRVALLLQSTLPRGERFNWTPDKGGDAARQLIVRYGWPSRMFFMGSRTMDSSEVFDHPLVTTEYLPGRIHTVPSWNAIVKPLEVTDDDWSINPPESMRFPAPVFDANGAIAQPMEFRKQQTRAIGWWPVEHMERARPLLILSEVQLAMLRRDKAIEVAIASDLRDSALSSGEFAATLMRSSASDVVAKVAAGNAHGGGRAIVRGAAPSEPTILSFEVQSRDPNGADARTRFGVTTPPTLTTMRTTEFALSDPVLVEAPRTGTDLVADPDSAIGQMLGSTHVKGRKQVGVYWESYGFTSSDTVEVTLGLSKLDRPGAARRVAVALRLAGDSRPATTITWTEPRPGQLTRTSNASRTIQHRAVTLDLGDVAPGSYLLEVTMRKRGQAAVVGQRAFTFE